MPALARPASGAQPRCGWAPFLCTGRRRHRRPVRRPWRSRGQVVHRAPFARPATVRGRVAWAHWSIGPRIAAQCGRVAEARAWAVRDWARARYQRPSPFHPSSLSPPGSAAPAQGHFGHTLSVRRRSGAAPQRGGRLVARSAIAAWRDHHVSIGGGCHAQEQRWNGQIVAATSATETPVGGRRRPRT